MENLRDKVLKDAYMAIGLINMQERGILRLDHPQQRAADQWTDIAKSGLIATIIKDEDIDSLKICEQVGDNGVTLWLIDGKQRFTTIWLYRQGMFKIGKSIEYPIVKYQVAQRNSDGKFVKDEDGNVIYDIIEYDIRDKFYNDLPDELKERIDNYKVNIVKHLNCTDEEVGYHMRRYNRCVRMNTSQDSVTYLDNVARYVKDISGNNRFFKDCGKYTESEKKKGVLDRVVVESVMTSFHIDNWKKNGKAMGAFVNGNVPKSDFDKLDNNMTRINNLFSENVSLFNSKNTFIWLAAFERFTQYGLDDIRFKDFIEAFVSELHSKKIDGVSFDEMEGNKATKDKKIIEQKLHILVELMKEFLHSNNENEETLLGFTRSNVEVDITDEDIDVYEEDLQILTLSVNNATKLLNKANHYSLIAIVAYSYKQDILLDDWFVDFFGRNSNYLENQADNYKLMKADLDKYNKKIA